MATRALTLDDVNLLDHDLFAEREPWDVFELLQREAPVFRHPGARRRRLLVRDALRRRRPGAQGHRGLLLGERRRRADRARPGRRARGAAQLHGDRPAAALAVAPHVRARLHAALARAALQRVPARAHAEDARRDAAEGRVRLRRADRRPDPDPRARPHARRARRAPRQARGARRPHARADRPRPDAADDAHAGGVEVPALRLRGRRRAAGARPAADPGAQGPSLRRRALDPRQRRDRRLPGLAARSRQQPRAARRGRQRDDPAGHGARDARADGAPRPARAAALRSRR